MSKNGVVTKTRTDVYLTGSMVVASMLLDHALRVGSHYFLNRLPKCIILVRLLYVQTRKR